MNYKNKKSNLSKGMFPYQVETKSDVKKYCFDNEIPPPKFSAKLKMMFVNQDTLNYHQYQALYEMANRIGYDVCFSTKGIKNEIS